MWGLERLAAGAALCATAMGGAWWGATDWRPSPEDYPVQGVDVDASTGAIDWGTARARDVAFAYVSATSGDAARDPAFQGHWTALAEQGIRRGAVHHYSLCADAAAQADHFNATVPRTADALPAVVAFSFSEACAARPEPAALLKEIGVFLARVERHTGRPALIRVDAAFEDAYRLSEGVARTFWGERLFFEPDYLARGWKLWQANDRRRVDGFERPVHWNVVAS